MAGQHPEQGVPSRELPVGSTLTLDQMHDEILRELAQLRRQVASGLPERVTQIIHLQEILEKIQRRMTDAGQPLTETLVGEATKRAARSPAR